MSDQTQGDENVSDDVLDIRIRVSALTCAVSWLNREQYSIVDLAKILPKFEQYIKTGKTPSL